MLAIFFIPVIGVLVFLLIGRSGLPPERSKLQHGTAELVEYTGSQVEATGHHRDIPEWAREAARINLANGAMPMVSGNTAQVLQDYGESLDSMRRAVQQAKTCVHFQFYIVALDETTEPLIAALEDAHRRGVDVRVLIDHLGSLGFPGYKDVIGRLDQAGIKWRRMLPVRPWRGEYQRPDLRNHRKVLVVDGSVAFTGSQNVTRRNQPRAGWRLNRAARRCCVRYCQADRDSTTNPTCGCSTTSFIVPGAVLSSRAHTLSPMNQCSMP